MRFRFAKFKQNFLSTAQHRRYINNRSIVRTSLTRTYVEFENIASSLTRKFDRPRRLLNVIDSHIEGEQERKGLE